MNNDKRGSWAARNVAAVTIMACLSAPSGCATGPGPMQVRVLQAQPSVTFKTLGMVSGQGPTVAAAIEHAKAQAAEMGADAVIVGHQHSLGNTWVVSVKAIRHMAPPPAGPQ